MNRFAFDMFISLRNQRNEADRLAQGIDQRMNNCLVEMGLKTHHRPSYADIFIALHRIDDAFAAGAKRKDVADMIQSLIARLSDDQEFD